MGKAGVHPRPRGPFAEGGEAKVQALCLADAKKVNLASVERAEVLEGRLMSRCPGLGWKRRRAGEGTRAQPQATDLTGEGRPPDWPGRGRGVSFLHLPFHPHIPELVSELRYWLLRG